MIVSLEGLPGAGKSTTAKLLPDHGPIEYRHERSSEHPFLAAFYSDVERYKFETEVVFAMLHYHQYRDIDRTAATVLDYSPVKDLIFADLNLDGDDHRLFTTLYERTLGSQPLPDLAIFLDLELEHLRARIAARGRDYEQDLDPAYLVALSGAYEQRFDELGTHVVRVPVTPNMAAPEVAAAVAVHIWA